MEKFTGVKKGIGGTYPDTFEGTKLIVPKGIKKLVEEKKAEKQNGD